MPASDERPFVAHVADAMEAALESGERPSPFTRGAVSEARNTATHIEVTSDSVLVFDSADPRMDLPLRLLGNILGKQSTHAGRIYDYIKENVSHGREEGAEVRRMRYTALRLAVTLRDTLSQMEALLYGLDLDHWESPAGHPPSEDEMRAEAVRQAATEAVVTVGDPLDPIPQYKLREAEIHKRLSMLQAEIRRSQFIADTSLVCDDIENIKRYIRGDNNG